MLPSINLELFAWAVCFAITDHALFSRELFFYPSKKYLFICTRLLLVFSVTPFKIDKNKK